MTEAMDSLADANSPDREWEYVVDGYVDHAARAHRIAVEQFRKQYPDNPDLEDWRYFLRKQPRTPPAATGG